MANTPLYRRSLNHPSSSLEAADLIRIDRGQNGLLKLPISRDVDLLLANFGEVLSISCIPEQPNYDPHVKSLNNSY